LTDRFDDVFGGRVDPARPKFSDRIRNPLEPPPANEASETVVGEGPYKAYGYLPTSHLGEGCDLRWWIDGTDQAEGLEFSYRFLMKVTYIGDREIRLYLPDTIVVIVGANLRDLRKKIARRQCTFVQAWSNRVWPGPVPDEALVERILAHRPDRGAAAA